MNNAAEAIYLNGVNDGLDYSALKRQLYALHVSKKQIRIWERKYTRKVR